MKLMTIVALVLAVLSFVFLPAVCIARPSYASKADRDAYKPTEGLIASIFQDDERPVRKSSKAKGKNSSKKSSSSKGKSSKSYSKSSSRGSSRK